MVPPVSCRKLPPMFRSGMGVVVEVGDATAGDTLVVIVVCGVTDAVPDTVTVGDTDWVTVDVFVGVGLDVVGCAVGVRVGVDTEGLVDVCVGLIEAVGVRVTVPVRVGALVKVVDVGDVGVGVMIVHMGSGIFVQQH